MSAQTTAVLKEPIHLLLMRSVVYTAALLTATWPIAGLGVNVAVVASALAGVVAGRQLAATRLRTWAIAAACGGLVLLGWIVGGGLGSATWFAHMTGPSNALAATQGVTLGLGALGLVTLFRVLALRRPVLALLEVLVGAAVVIGSFSGHRDFQIAQPRFLADWAFSTGRDPFTILMVIGLGTLAALVPLFLPRQRLRRTLSAMLGLFLLVGVLSWVATSPLGFSMDPDQSPSSTDDDTLTYNDRRTPDSEKKQPVALVTFRNSLAPWLGTYHFRTKTYSQLENNRLTVATLAGTNDDVPTTFPGGDVAIAGNALPPNLGADVATTVATVSKLRAPLALVTATAMSPEVNPDPNYFVQVYGIRSRAMPKNQSQQLANLARKAPAGNPAWSDAVRQHYLEVPNDPRYKELSDRVLAEERRRLRLPANAALSPVERGAAFLSWIKVNTTYSLAPGNGEAPDPAADFLFGSQKGFCVHVATSMTYMLRTQGVSARVSGGFAAGPDRRGNGSTLLLQKSDAHAWCEIYLQGIGWVPFDGSPDKSEEPPPPRPGPETKNYLQNRFEKKNNERRTADLPKDTNDEAGTLSGFASNLWHGMLPAGFLLVVALYSVKIWRLLAPRFASARQLHRVAFRAALDRLAEVGFVRNFGETREEFADRLATIIPELPGVTADHLRGAMGGDKLASGSPWIELQKTICQRLAGHVSRTRRYLGLANPVSWVIVR